MGGVQKRRCRDALDKYLNVYKMHDRNWGASGAPNLQRLYAIPLVAALTSNFCGTNRLPEHIMSLLAPIRLWGPVTVDRLERHMDLSSQNYNARTSFVFSVFPVEEYLDISIRSPNMRPMDHNISDEMTECFSVKDSCSSGYN